MKQTKVLLAAMMLLFGATQVNAQVTFGIKGGLNASKFVYKEDGTSFNAYALTGFHIGVTAEAPLTEKLFIQPAFLFSAKGGKLSENEGLADDEKYRFMYVEIPVNLLYKYSLSDDINAFGYAGPYAGFLLSAKDKYANESESVKDDMKTLDAGMNIGLGVEVDKLTFGIQYGFGLTNTLKTSDATEKNRVFSISIGYKFRKD